MARRVGERPGVIRVVIDRRRTAGVSALANRSAAWIEHKIAATPSRRYITC